MREVSRVGSGPRHRVWWELMVLRGLDLRVGPAYERHGRERTLTLSVPGFAVTLWWQR